MRFLRLTILLAAIPPATGCTPIATEERELDGTGWTGTDQPASPAGGRGDLRPGTGDDVERAQVLTVLTAYYRDYRRRDWQAMITHFWPDAMVLTTPVAADPGTSDVTTMTAAEFVANARRVFGGMSAFSVTMGATDVRVSGDLAQVWAEHHVSVGDGTEVLRARDIDAFTLLRVGERWRIASLSFAE